MQASALRQFSLSRRAAARAARWARRRQGVDATGVRLRPGRIYILPTGVGLVFAVMTFAMLLGSMNYNNNLSFVLTFMLASLGFVSMHQCQRNLIDLEIGLAGVDPVFAGQSIEFRIALTNHARNRRHALQLFSGGATTERIDLGPGESRVLSLAVPTTRRGRMRLERFGLRSLFPLEMFRAWAWLHMDVEGLVYPRPADEAAPPPPARAAHGHRQHDARGEEDFAGFCRFQDGDSPRHVAWKAYARSGELYSKQFAGADTSSQWLDFDEVRAMDPEQRLSILARWIIDADRTHSDYGLRLPGSKFPPAHGDAHRHRCLEALALFDAAELQA